MTKRAWTSTAVAVLTLATTSFPVTPAHADPAVAVGGTVTADGAPVAGAFVALTGDAALSAVSGADGTYAVSGVPTGTYTIAAQAPGYAVAQAKDVSITTSLTHDVALTSSGTKFTALGVFGAQIASIVPDGKSGVFYASTSVIPQIYRTADWGGTWTPVTLAADDPTEGLVSDNVAAGLTSSGYPGELAALVGNGVRYSKDFGVTWQTVGGQPAGSNGPAGPKLFWGHAGATSVLLSVSDTETKRADMTATTPAFATMTNGLLGSGKQMAVANALDGAYVAVVDAAGSLSVYTLDASSDPLSAVGSPLSGFPASPTFVRFGGVQGAGAPPAAVLVYSSTGSAALATKAASAAGFVSGDIATTAISPSCGAGAGAIGSVSPISADTTGAAVVAQCFLDKSGGTLTPHQVNGINNNTGAAFDAGYGTAPDYVVIAGDGGRGLVKSVVSGTPVIPPGDATAGDDPGAGAQGGFAVNGFTVPVVKDAVFGPAGASQLAAIMSASGGRVATASEDGGTTMVTAMRNGGRAVAWWQGAAETWLVFGGGGGGPLLGAIADWTATTPALPGPNVPGSDGGTIGIAGNFEVTALAPVRGTGIVFIGGGTDVDQQGTQGSVKRATLTAGSPPTLTGLTAIGSGSAAVRALAYCPTIGGDSDVLLVATATSSQAGSPGGGISRITGATGSPAATGITLDGANMVNDLRAHCGSHTVWAAAGSNGGGPAGTLYKSTDGGKTFAAVTVAGAGVAPNLNFQVVAVSPSDPDEVLVAANSEGVILRTTDGGSHWTVVNDPHAPGGRNFLSEGVGDLEIPPAAASLVAGRATVTSSKALVGTGGGLYASDIRAGATCTDASSCGDDDPCTDDACTGGACRNTRQTGVAGATCEAGKLDDAGLCGSDPVDKKLAALLRTKGGRAGKLLGKASSNPKKAPKLLKGLGTILNALDKGITKAVKKHKVTSACGTALHERIAAIRGAL